MARNINMSSRDLSLFELGEVFFKKGKKDYEEAKHLAIGLTGRLPSGWQGPSREVGFFDLKGVFEAFLSEMGVSGARFLPAQNGLLSKGVAASIEMGGKTIGFTGELSKRVLDDFGIDQKVYCLEVSFAQISSRAVLAKKYAGVPKFPSTTRDISMMADEGVPNSRIVDLIEGEGGGLVKGVVLFDLYSGKQIPEGKKSLAYRIEYRHPSKTLEDPEVNAVHSRICHALTAVLGAKIR
jgi:phenylalanyl-tRNA synthetase beta chain